MGNMTPDRLAFSGPAWGALYPEPPHFYRNSANLILSYETDLQAVVDRLPEGVEPLDDHPRVVLWFQDTPFSTFGNHQAAYAFLECSFEGQPYLFEAFLWVTSESAMAAGRELWGDSKTLAEISLGTVKEEIVASLRRTADAPLASARMRLTGWGAESDLPQLPGLCLKMIPDATSPRSFKVLQLVTDDMDNTVVVGSDGRAEIFTGVADVELTSSTTLDPIGTLIPRGPIQATYARLHTNLDYGRVLKDYLA